MKLDFQEVTVKNFFSYGAKPTTINFKESIITLITGTNGKGKSAIICDSIFFALFGKPSRDIKIKSVINDINKKNCVVDLKFIVNDKLPCRIIRGLNPDFLEFYKGDEKEDSRSSKKLMQKELDNFLQINFDTLKNVCILSSNQSIPFLDMKPHEVRPVIENIFKTYIYSQMLAEIKNHRTTIVDKMRSLEQDLKLYNSVIEDYKNSAKRMKDLKENFEKDKIEKLEKYQQQHRKLNNEWLEINSKISDVDYDVEIIRVRDKVKKLDILISEMNRDLAILHNNIKKLEERKELITNNNSCPVCSSELTEKHKKQELENIEKMIKSYLKECFEICRQRDEEIKTEKEKLEIEIKELLNVGMENNELKNNKKELDYELEIIKRNIDNLKNDTIDKHFSNIVDITKVKEYVEKKKINEAELIEFQRDLTYSDTIKNILADDGVKSAVIKRDLPFLNTKVNEYLRIMGFNINIEFNETFDLIITNIRKSGYQYQSFSNGQKKRIDLAILLSFIDLAKRKNSFSSNLLILDEILDTSIDQEGLDNFFQILYNKINIDNLNIFIISHKKDINFQDCKKIEVGQDGEFSMIFAR